MLGNAQANLCQSIQSKQFLLVAVAADITAIGNEASFIKLKPVLMSHHLQCAALCDLVLWPSGLIVARVSQGFASRIASFALHGINSQRATPHLVNPGRAPAVE